MFLVEFSQRCGNGGKTHFVFPGFPWRGSFHSPVFCFADSFQSGSSQLIAQGVVPLPGVLDLPPFFFSMVRRKR
jgi:hypothetical protein